MGRGMFCSVGCTAETLHAALNKSSMWQHCTMGSTAAVLARLLLPGGVPVQSLPCPCMANVLVLLCHADCASL